MQFLSPLRYPGGKRKLANYIKLIFHQNSLCDGIYAEPYAGGAAVALALLFGEYASQVYINDIDPGIHAFWDCVINETDELCEAITKIPITIDEWCRQKEVQNRLDVTKLQLAVSTFFLNRTNRSGIISGGVIGGKKQTGKWKIDARFNKTNLIQRIRKVSRYRDRINLFNIDAKVFIAILSKELPKKSLTFFDPPYFVKGQQLLYSNYYSPNDHSHIAELIARLKTPWIVSYDDVDEIRRLYLPYQLVEYDLSYSAQDRYRGQEVLFASDDLILPDVTDPSKIRQKDLLQPKFGLG